ncbi:hypothetical protein J7I98_04335 [Streptomyces sp. ISL-98]|uniref:hypothetical protein n=1 Tax=Streptomyces sp. ISL-98 TaxID=2819192 RepID=UPI001BE7FCC4|nr:hypothetical protein [Streptomyces sp. ISL-98]MBT2505136.1 hypothetical protein [Streptomyces sp. ISL-98]
MTDSAHSALGDELPRLVGAAAVEGARAEFALRYLLVGLLDSQYAEIVAAGVPVGTLIANCKTIASEHLGLDKQQKTKAEDFLSDIEGLMKARNRLVHSILAIDQSDVAGEQSQQITALYSTYQKPGRSETMSVDKAREVAEKLRTAADELLIWTISTLPAASQQQVHPD